MKLFHGKNSTGNDITVNLDEVFLTQPDVVNGTLKVVSTGCAIAYISKNDADRFLSELIDNAEGKF